MAVPQKEVFAQSCALCIVFSTCLLSCRIICVMLAARPEGVEAKQAVSCLRGGGFGWGAQEVRVEGAEGG